MTQPILQPLHGLEVFVLGNGPTLPVDKLFLLRNHVTIGVNAILKSGFVPDVILWTDTIVGERYHEAFDDVDSLKITTLYCARPSYIALPLIAGSDARRYPATPKRLHCDGNSAVCAARWALSCGADHVYMAGCNADETGHFYALDDDTQYMISLRKSLDRFLESKPEVTVLKTECQFVNAATEVTTVINKQKVMDGIREATL